MGFPTPFPALVCTAEPPTRIARESLWKDYHNLTQTGWLSKPAAESKLLDDAMTGPAWQLVNVDQAHGEVPPTGGRCSGASESLRLRCTRIDSTP